MIVQLTLYDDHGSVKHVHVMGVETFTHANQLHQLIKRTLVKETLQQNSGNVTHTAHALKAALRTIRYWKNHKKGQTL